MARCAAVVLGRLVFIVSVRSRFNPVSGVAARRLDPGRPGDEDKEPHRDFKQSSRAPGEISMNRIVQFKSDLGFCDEFFQYK
nr:hypothetical protein [uncultured Lichenicoccus sp.]